jgi:ABC-2 type transport system permease protein
MRRALLPLLWREIESLFFSPLAYIVLFIFLVLNGFSFIFALETANGVVSDTIAVFLGDGPLFWLSLMVIPPLVTMRLVAEERRSGLLEITLTAPVRDGEVILAKFIGAMVFQAFLWAPTLIYIAIIRNYGALPDPGQVVTSYVGIACVTSLLTAVGLAYSTITSNQIVAAVASMTTNVIVLIIPVLADARQYTALTRLLEPLSFFGHFSSSFNRGVLDSSILVFYAAATLGLLVLCTRSLEVRKWR